MFTHRLAALPLLLLATHASGDLFVDDDAPPGGDGLAWATAFDSLQDAITASASGETIRIAQGTYRPDQGAGIFPGSEFEYFNLTDRILLGAHAGLGAPDPDARDPDLYITILSGDLAANDGPEFQNTEDNTHTIFEGSRFTLDGCTITGAAGGLTGATIEDGSLITRCRFHHNSAENGGALTTETDAPFDLPCEVRDCVFEQNRAPWDGVNQSGTGFGGAVYLQGDGETRFYNCRFSRNHATNGGAVGSWFEGDPGGEFFNCTFTANVADHPDTWSTGGAICFIAGSSATISFFHCLIYENHAPNGIGGGVYTANGQTLIMNSILWSNTDVSGRSFEAQTTRPPRGTGPVPPFNIIEDAPSGQTFNFYALPFEPLFIDPIGPDAVLGTDDDNFVPAFGSPAIDAAPALAFDLEFDARGLPRPVDDPATPDLRPGETGADFGPFEYQEDCDDSGVFDSVEISNATLDDCDADGVPDLCQPFNDCNTNTINDRCEIASGSVSDCNNNAVPDLCDIELGTSTDTNDNDIPDECEPAILYVNAANTAHAPRTGDSWPAAYTDLQNALADARARSAPSEIWVASGTYHPTYPGGPIRHAFDIPPGLTLLAGFDGTETDASQRDHQANTTILSGDLLENDHGERAGVEPDPLEDNTFTLLRIGRGRPCTIDGFTIQGGYARNTPAPGTVVFTFVGEPDEPDITVARQFNDTGSAVRLIAGEATFNRCRFAHNHVNAGSIIDVSRAATLTLEDCAVEHNTTLKAGADVFGNDDFATPYRAYSAIEALPKALSHLDITRSTIAANTAPESSNGAADVIDVGLTDINLDRVLITANQGFAASIDTYIGESQEPAALGMASTLTMRDSAIIANEGTAVAIIDERFDTEDRDELVIINSTIAHNDAGIDLQRAFPDIHNSILFANTDFQIFPAALALTEFSSLRHSTIEGFDPADNNGANITNNIPDNPLFIDTLGPDATPRTGDENFRLQSGSTSIDSGDTTAAIPGSGRDLDGNSRFADDPGTPNPGPTTPPGPVDRGAWERQSPRALSPADINGDRRVDTLDFAVLALTFGDSVEPGHGADLNADGAIDVRDFAIFARHFGQSD